MVAAFFPEVQLYRGNPFDVTKAARPLYAAILARSSVVALAPEHLVYEFTKTAHRKTKEGRGTDLESVTRQVDDFLYLWGQGIRRVPMGDLAKEAWRLSTREQIAPPDSWYLACAIIHKAELWIASRDTKDHFADHAREVHQEVYVLTGTPFNEP